MDYWPYKDGFRFPLSGKTISFPEEFLESHSLVLGKTGSGKSNLLAQLIDVYRDAGKNVIVFDSHGELWKYGGDDSSIISLSPLFLNGVGFLKFNLMGILPYKNETEKTINEDLVIFTLKDIFSNEETFSHGTWGPRIETVFTILPRLLQKYRVMPTITDMLELLMNYYARKDFASSLEQQDRSQFYTIFNQGYDFISSSMNKILPLVSSDASKKIFSSRSDYYDISKFKGTLYVDLSAEHSSSAISRPFAIMMLYKIWNNILLGRMRNTVLVIDEFQTISPFISQKFINEGRKFGLWLTAATQSLSNLPIPIREALKTNVHNFFLFQLSPDDEKAFRSYGLSFKNPGFHEFVALIPRESNHFNGIAMRHAAERKYEVDSSFYDFDDRDNVQIPNQFDPYFSHILISNNLATLVDGKIIPTEEYLKKIGSRTARGSESIYHRYLVTRAYFYFKSEGLEVFENVEMNERKPDLVLMNDGKKIAVECEYSDIRKPSRIREKSDFYGPDVIFVTFKGYEQYLPKNRVILLIPPIGDTDHPSIFGATLTS